MVLKRKCDKCPAVAVWNYVPSGVEAYYCEDHVPRGCSCMTDNDGNSSVDEVGRKLPCIEFDYCYKGFVVEL